MKQRTQSLLGNFSKLAFLFMSFTIISFINVQAAEQGQLPSQGIQVHFQQEDGHADEVTLFHTSDGFAVKVGEEMHPVQDCFVPEPLRKINPALLRKYFANGGKIAIHRVADGSFELQLGGGLQGGETGCMEGLIFAVIVVIKYLLGIERPTVMSTNRDGDTIITAFRPSGGRGNGGGMLG